MKHLRFRVWHKKRKKYYEVHHLHLDTIGVPSNPKEWATCKAYNCIEQKNIYIQIQPKEAILEQYTGLTDKNGVKIYEGDILKSGEYIMTVSWCYEMATFCLNRTGWMYSHFFKEGCEAGESEIIGNIHEEETC